MGGFADAIAAGGDDPIEKACWLQASHNQETQDQDIAKHMRAVLR